MSPRRDASPSDPSSTETDPTMTDQYRVSAAHDTCDTSINHHPDTQFMTDDRCPPVPPYTYAQEKEECAGGEHRSSDTTAAAIAATVTDPNWRERIATAADTSDLLATAFDYLRATIASGLTPEQRTRARTQAAALLVHVAEQAGR